MTTGFDYETYTYYIGYDSIGRYINAYVPAAPSQASLAFTVIGEPPPPPPLVVSFSGPTSLPPNQNGTWTCTATGGMGTHTGPGAHAHLWEYKYACSGGGGDDRQSGGAEPLGPTCGSWSGIGTGSSLTKSFQSGFSTAELRLTVTDAAGTIGSHTETITLSTNLQGGGAAGGEETAAVALAEAGAPVAFALQQARPNPFAEATMLRFALPEGAEVRLAVYDALGREVALLAEGLLEAGYHEAVFDGAALPNGVYVVRLVAGVASGARVASERVTLMR